MRKSFVLVLILSFSAAWMVGCGDSAKTVTPAPVPNVAFMQEAGSYLFTPRLGTFTTSGNTITFTESGIVDTTTSQPVTAEFYSIILSKDGTKAALDLYGGLDGTSDQWDIFVANSDGTSNPVQITNDVNDDRMPQLSPDGTKVIFNSIRLGTDTYEHSMLVTRSTTGSNEQVLPLPLNASSTYSPTYSPDGSKIAVEAWGYDINDNYFDGLVVMNADGSNPQLLTNPGALAEVDAFDETPSYTSDGTKIVFSGYTYDYNTSTETEDVYIMNADGTGVTQLTDGMAIYYDPIVVNIAGVGDKILFSSNRDNLGVDSTGFEIYMMNMDGSNITRLTTNSLYDSFSGDWYNSGTTAARAARHMHRNIHAQRQPYKGHNPGHIVQW